MRISGADYIRTEGIFNATIFSCLARFRLLLSLGENKQSLMMATTEDRIEKSEDEYPFKIK